MQDRLLFAFKENFMKSVLSKTQISSFCGDVVPLYIDFKTTEKNTLANAHIKWSCDGDAVSLRTFDGNDEISRREQAPALQSITMIKGF